MTTREDAPRAEAQEPKTVMHYGSNGGAECGAHGDGHVPDHLLTMKAIEVTCPTCRGWLPIVAPDWRDAYPQSAPSTPPPGAASPAEEETHTVASAKRFLNKPHALCSIEEAKGIIRSFVVGVANIEDWGRGGLPNTPNKAEREACESSGLMATHGSNARVEDEAFDMTVQILDTPTPPTPAAGEKFDCCAELGKLLEVGQRADQAVRPRATDSSSVSDLDVARAALKTAADEADYGGLDRALVQKEHLYDVLEAVDSQVSPPALAAVVEQLKERRELMSQQPHHWTSFNQGYLGALDFALALLTPEART